ncbi:MAG: FAD:protein FMN transferase [Pseudomonadota bacterium]
MTYRVFSRRWCLALIMLVAGSLFGCTTPAENQSFRILAFGTYIDVTLSGVDAAQAATAREYLERDFAAMQQAWHAWEPGPVGRINQLIRAGSPPFAASPSTLPLLRRAQQLAAQSDYLFDPGIGQLIAMWGFQGNARSQPPTADQIQVWLRDRPSIGDLTLDGLYLSSDNPRVQLDFGAIGKGYGISQAMQRLRSLGIQHAIINAGGDMQAIGTNQGQPWRIAIRDPQGAPDSVLGVLSVSGHAAVFTSGDYERRFTWQGKVYHHILDPRTGYPATGLSSVTVVHKDATLADAAATALFIAGPDDWRRIAQQMNTDAVLVVDTQGQVQFTPAMQQYLSLRHADGENGSL